MPFITLPSHARLHHITYGDGSRGTPILCLNGMTQTTLSWKSLARSLAAQARVITYDARGQGESEVSEQVMSLDEHVQDLVALLDALDLERVHLVGFSHGARIALAAAASHPERVEKLVLASATASPTVLADTIVKGWAEILRLGGLEAMSWAALPAILGDAYLTQNRKLIPGIIRASVQRNDAQGVAKLLEGMMMYPAMATMAPEVKAPTRVIYGEHDLLVEASGARELARLCKGDCIELGGVGHTVPIEAPQAFESAMMDFLRG